MPTLVFAVSGMSCGHCVRAVDEALRSVAGVTVNAVEIGRASITLDEAKASVSDVIDAVADAGYEAVERSG
jgi:copper chaperone